MNRMENYTRYGVRIQKYFITRYTLDAQLLMQYMHSISRITICTLYCEAPLVLSISSFQISLRLHTFNAYLPVRSYRYVVCTINNISANSSSCSFWRKAKTLDTLKWYNKTIFVLCLSFDRTEHTCYVHCSCLHPTKCSLTLTKNDKYMTRSIAYNLWS